MTVSCFSGELLRRFSLGRYDREEHSIFLEMGPLFSLVRRTTTRCVSVKYLGSRSYAHPFRTVPQFLDPLLLSLEVYRETHRQVRFLTAAKSMDRKWVGFFARLMDSSKSNPHCCPNQLTVPLVPVARAADSAKPATGRIWLSPDDPCLVLGEGTQFTKEFTPKMQIMLPKSVNSPVAEVSEVLSDTELRIKREFGGESGKGTARIREKVTELRQEGISGLEFKKMPYVDQQDMYRHVYQCLKDGGAIGIFPEGEHITL